MAIEYAASRVNEYSIMYSYGSIVKHTPLFKPTITEPSLGYEALYLTRSNRNNPYAPLVNFPLIGFGMSYFHFGDNEIFGDAFGVSSYIKFLIREREKSCFFLRLGAGLGYCTQTHKTQFDNNVIGSHCNILASIVSGFSYRLTPNISATINAGISHLSNARTTRPNLGINYIYGQMGLLYQFEKSTTFTKKTFLPLPFGHKKHVIQIGIGASDKGSDQSNHVLPTFSLNYLQRHYTGRNHYINFGGSLAYKNDNYDDAIYGFLPNSDASIIMGDELFLGKVSLGAMIGLYLYPISKSTNYWYQKYSINYTIPFYHSDLSLLTGVQIKTHYGKAELGEFKVGLVF